MTREERTRLFRSWRQLATMWPDKYRVRFEIGDYVDTEIVTVLEEWCPKRHCTLRGVHLTAFGAGPGWSVLERLPEWIIPL